MGLVAFIKSIKGSRNEPEDFAGDEFIDGVEGTVIRLDYSGKNSSIMRDITVAHASWVESWLSRPSDRQIQDAFRAAIYNAEEVRMLGSAVRKRIQELMSLQPASAMRRSGR